jgi:hypothetical protein
MKLRKAYDQLDYKQYEKKTILNCVGFCLPAGKCPKENLAKTSAGFPVNYEEEFGGHLFIARNCSH